MGDTNYFSGIVKVLENPNKQLINNKSLVTTIRVEVPQRRKNKLIYTKFWGNLGKEVFNFYKINDYILIEGYISLRKKTSMNSSITNLKQVTVTVLRVYPILLNPNRN